jgi:putative CocE/NonD family hydrolase
MIYGVALATDFYRPSRGGIAAEGRFPALLCRTPYNRNTQRNQGEWLARRGYVVLAQDVRGRFASEGEFYPFVNEGPDGFDTVEWAARQPWSDGQVGTYGASYLAWNQYHAAMYRPPHLVAMFAVVGGADFYREYAYPGGAPNPGWAVWLAFSASVEDPSAWLKLPHSERAAALKPAQRKAYEDFRAHPRFDSYWKRKGFYTAGYYRLMKDVPALFLTGWYDYFAEGALRNFTELARRQRTPKKLIVGPWAHETGPARCGDVSFGAHAAVSHRELLLDWVNHWMKGRRLDVVPPEPVRVFRMGGGSRAPDHGGEWVAAPSWPLPGTRTTPYYLGSGGVLGPAPPARGESSSFAFDPRNPVPTIGGRYTLDGPPCAQDQGPPNRRQDVLSYLTAPLDSPVDVTGAVRCLLQVSSDAPETDFTAKLMDVYPDGYALIISDGIIRARGAAKVRIDLGSTSNLFGKGHRIRLDVSSSNYPRSEPHPRPARNTVHYGFSRLELPVRRVDGGL